ncbi:MAG: hypothetical protein ACRDJW_11425 [Thermomicrobiales bacterium]
MQYNLWDVEIGKYLGQFASEDEALAAVRRVVELHGADYAGSLALGRVADDGTIMEPIAGQDLVVRANQVIASTAAS